MAGSIGVVVGVTVIGVVSALYAPPLLRHDRVTFGRSCGNPSLTAMGLVCGGIVFQEADFPAIRQPTGIHGTSARKRGHEHAICVSAPPAGVA